MRQTIRCACIMLIVFLAATGAYPALQIDANFDSGSIGTYSIDDGNSTVNLTLRTETLPNTGDQYTYWTNFKVLDALDRTVTFRITNANLVTFLKSTTQEAQMVYSCDGENWNRIVSHSYSSPTYTFTQSFSCSEPQIATFFPFSYTRMSQFVDQVSTSPWVQRTVLGSSAQGRNINLLTITDPAVPPTAKDVIYIVGRQHAAETSSSHMLEGLINFLISDEYDAFGLRSHYVWHIVPMTNPDGVYLGNSRATSELRDPNRDWHENNQESVETSIVRTHANSVRTASGIDIFIDWHSQITDSSWYNFTYAPLGNTFFQYLSAWTDFDSQKTLGTSCDASSCSARGYATIKLNVLMFGPEPTPHLVTWSEESLKNQGVNFAFAVNDYYGRAVPCSGDFVPDGDVDGSDLAALIANQSLLNISTFAVNFAKNTCY